MTWKESVILTYSNNIWKPTLKLREDNVSLPETERAISLRDNVSLPETERASSLEEIM